MINSLLTSTILISAVTGPAASTASGAIGVTELPVKIQEFAIPPVPDPLPARSTHVDVSGNTGKIEKLARVPSSVSSAAFQIRIQSIMRVKAEARGAGGVA